MTASGDMYHTDKWLQNIVELPCGLYPGIESFSPEYGFADYCNWVEQGNGDPTPAPLALYVQDSASAYQPESPVSVPPSFERTDTILQELRLQGRLVDSDRPLRQFTCAQSVAVEWNDDQLYQLVTTLQESFFVHQDSLSNWCVCLGLSTPSAARLRLLRVLGFNHMRIGLRLRADCDDTFEPTGALIGDARRLGMERVSVELIQVSGVERDVSREARRFLIASSPDRIQLVGSNGAQYESVVQLLSTLGYDNIGLDWFVRPNDPWLQLKAAGQLHWSMLGFTGVSAPDVIGVGPGAISSVCEFYGLLEDRWDHYRTAIQQGEIPVVRGIELEPDDVLRREIMDMILAASIIPVGLIEEKWGIRFNYFFAREVAQLRELRRTGAVEWSGGDIVMQTRQRSALVELCRIFHHRQPLQNARSGLICV